MRYHEFAIEMLQGGDPKKLGDSEYAEKTLRGLYELAGGENLSVSDLGPIKELILYCYDRGWQAGMTAAIKNENYRLKRSLELDRSEYQGP